ncbi:MAG: hypothetical protein R3213_04395, partial [Flavobacteriaceae bacterium]|nr:hypothetical protein [Flavobacteriaceae bacterium]
AGSYSHSSGNGVDHLIEYKLDLKDDGTFSYHYKIFIKEAISNIPDTHGEGKWWVEGKLVYFESVPKVDPEDKRIDDFNGTEARFSTKSPRDKSGRDIPTKLVFYKTNIMTLQGVELMKD